MSMPGDLVLGIGNYFGDALVDAVNSGDVSESRIDVRYSVWSALYDT
jgi:hypothetical protein